VKSEHHVVDDATTDGLPIAPALGVALDSVNAQRQPTLVDRRVLQICLLAIGLGFAAALIARLLISLINLVTNLAYFGRVAIADASPAHNHLGGWSILIPVAGGLIVGAMARYGSKAIRGHGIPEAMEQVLRNESRIPPRMTYLKPLSSAVAIGTGGPFGAEGPIIATGGALGSLIGQLLQTTASERKTLLSAGAAAGMSAVFGTPLSAVILAVELLLFEFRPRSIIPVALACVVAAAMRYAFVGAEPVFAMPALAQPSGAALLFYVVLGAAMGLFAVGVTRMVYAIEDLFEYLPLHWMWWPALGGLGVGIVGYFAPRTLGIGYDNIQQILGGHIVGATLIALCVLKLISWSIALGSGTSGGTLAPLFTIGSGFGAVLGAVVAIALPKIGIDPRIAALVGMAAMFAGASRALLASIVFSFETTQQPFGLLPLLGGCTAAYLVSCVLMRNTIMTEKIARRGTRVPSEYSADFLDHVYVREALTTAVIALRADTTLRAVREWLQIGGADAQHQGYPVLGENRQILGVVTRRDILDPAIKSDARVAEIVKRSLLTVSPEQTLREAADEMVRSDVGRLIVVSDDGEARMMGIITRGDVLRAHVQRLREAQQSERSIQWRKILKPMS
jgi:H+/Cl- antiporter ClcA/predicted transcriptional regulator